MLALIKTNPFSAVNTVLLIVVLAVSLDAKEHAADANDYARINSDSLMTGDYTLSIGDVVSLNNALLKDLDSKITQVRAEGQSNQDALSDLKFLIGMHCSS